MFLSVLSTLHILMHFIITIGHNIVYYILLNVLHYTYFAIIIPILQMKKLKQREANTESKRLN
jgi:hypothetical protein